MNAEKINEAIAIHLGWEKGIIIKSCGEPDRRQDWGWTPPREWLYSKSPSAQRYLNDLQNGNMAGPPDYCGDLNAINEAKKTLSVYEKIRFARHLMDEMRWHPVGCVLTYEEQLRSLGELLCGEANAQAKAFLRTIGKWEEE